MISHFVWLQMTTDRLDLKGENNTKMVILFHQFPPTSPHPGEPIILTTIENS